MTHQVIIINNSLKMSKGKIARICAFLTAKLVLNGVSSDAIWKCIVLKSDNYKEMQDYLDNIGQDYLCHIDAGFTQVEPMTNCGLTFIYPDNTRYPRIDELKLL